MKALRGPIGRVTTPWDVVLMIALATWAVIESLANDSAPHPTLRATFAAATLLSIAFRRTVPVMASVLFAVGMAAESLALEAPDEIGVILGLVVVSFSVSAHAPLRESLIGAALLSLSLAVTIAVDPSDSNANILPSMLLFIILPMAVGVTVNRRQRDIAALTLETEALSRDAETAVEAERRRIARELHDVVSHAVTLIAIQAEAGQSIFDSNPESAKKSLQAIGDVSREALDELARLLRLLRDDESRDADDVGLHRLPTLVEGARAAGLTINVTKTGTPRALPRDADHCAYRVVQEGLTNALRHSSGVKVSVTVNYEPQLVSLDIDSSGKRHQSEYGGTGRGLVGLRERVLALGGELESDRGSPGHFGLHATIPAPS